MGGSYQTTEYQQCVAAGSIPAIRQGDWVLHDSQAIVEYLNEQHPEPRAWSKDSKQRAGQRALVHYHDSKLEPAVRAFIPLSRQPNSTDRQQQVGLARDTLFDRLYRLERMMGQGTTWMLGDYSAADWTFPATIYLGLDLLHHLDCKLSLPVKIEQWLGHAMSEQVVQEEVNRLRGAIALWLSDENQTLN